MVFRSPSCLLPSSHPAETSGTSAGSLDLPVETDTQHDPTMLQHVRPLLIPTIPSESRGTLSRGGPGPCCCPQLPPSPFDLGRCM